MTDRQRMCGYEGPWTSSQHRSEEKCLQRQECSYGVRWVEPLQFALFPLLNFEKYLLVPT